MRYPKGESENLSPCESDLSRSRFATGGQIAGWLKGEYPKNPALWVSHETIYE